jgi:integrase
VVLRMARPWRHPRSGFYWFRKAIPLDLRPILGRREEKFSLKTKNPGEAQTRHAIKAAEIAEKWQRLRGNGPLDHVDFHALAGEYFRETVASKYRDPGDAQKYAAQLKKNFFAHTPPVRFNGNTLIYRRVTYGAEARAFLLRRGYRLEDEQLDKFLRAFGDAVKLSSEQLQQMAAGDYTPHKDAKKFPKFEPRKIGPELDLWSAWEKYSPRLKPSSRKRWRGVMRAVEARFGRDLATLTFEGLIEWRDHLLKKLHPTTVAEVYLAAIRWLLNRCLRDRKLLANVAAGIEVEQVVAQKTREREYTMDEAKLILAATLKPASKPMTVENAAVRRWVPWLLAYTGARLNEVTQIRHADIRPEKNPSDRDVPVHPHLVEQGFLTYVSTRSGLPLFYDPRRARKKSDENPYFKKIGERLAEWVRSVGIVDPAVQPNHAWRHLFKSTGRYARIPEDALDTLQGHRPRGEGAAYGSHWPHVSYNWIKQIPRYEVAPPAPIETPKSVARSNATKARDRRGSTLIRSRREPLASV